MATVWHLPAGFGAFVDANEDGFHLPASGGSVSPTTVIAAPPSSDLPLVPYKTPLPTHLRM